MMRFRFHIGTLLLIGLLIGVGFAALRESSDIWESGIFSLTLIMLLISILLAIHRTEKRRAFWLGFALFGWDYLGLSAVSSIEPRLMKTKALAYLDSKVPRSIPAGFASFDLIVTDSQPNVLYVNKGNGWIKDVTAVAGSNPAGEQAWFPNILAGSSLIGSSGTTENFVRIGHSLLALMAAFVGGQLSRHLHTKNRERTLHPSNPENGTEPPEPHSGPSQ
jgi:hypothetical protein